MNLKETLPNVDIKLDYLPSIHPYVPRLCKQRGYFFLWHGTPESDGDILEDSRNAKGESQWVYSDDPNKIEKAIALIYPYDDEIIIGTVKYPGYMKKRSKAERTKLLKSVWNDIIILFGDKRIICPSGTYFDYLHLCINQKRAPHEAYHRRIMKSYNFVKHDEYWVRECKSIG